MSKKIVSLILAAMLTASMVGTAALSVAAATQPGNFFTTDAETERVYFLMPQNWYNDYTDTAGVYWWEGTGACPSWGEMYQCKSESENIYYVDVPTDVTKIIFTNFVDGGEDSEQPIYFCAAQTSDLTINDEGTVYDPEFDNNELYPTGLNFEDLDGMIFVIDPDNIDESPLSHKQTCGGEWFYYYGEGNYGVLENAEEAAAKNLVHNQKDQQYFKHDDAVNEKFNAPAPVEPDSTGNCTDVDPEASLTVYATSNFFPSASVDYYEVADKAELPGQVTVSYYLDANSSLVNFQWLLKYDSSVLALASTNKPKTVMPQIGNNGSIYNFNLENAASANGSSLALYEISADVPFVTFTFDVVGKGETTVDLDVKTLSFGELDPDTDSVLQDSITSIVSGSEVKEDLIAKYEVNNKTVITPNTNKPEPVTTVPVTTAPVTTAPVTEPVTVATDATTSTTSTDATSATGTASTDATSSTTTTTTTNTNSKTNTNTVATGEASLAIVILGVLVASTGVMFVLRKKEML